MDVCVYDFIRTEIRQWTLKVLFLRETADWKDFCVGEVSKWEIWETLHEGSGDGGGRKGRGDVCVLRWLWRQNFQMFLEGYP